MPVGEERFLDFERRIKASFKVFNASTESRLSQYITNESVDWDSLLINFRPITNMFASDLVNIMILGANLTAADVSRQLGETVVFNVAGSAAVSAYDELRFRVMQGLQQQQAEALLEMRRLAQNMTATRTANMVHDGLLLTGRQVRAVDNFRSMLENLDSNVLQRNLRDKRFDPTIVSAIDSGKKLKAAQIDKMVERYSQKQLKFRADTIATTESVRIANAADHLFYNQAVSDGEILEENVIRSWVTSKDEKVRPSHRATLNQKRELKKPFITGDGNSLMYPGDPSAPASDTIRCRCWVVTKIGRLPHESELPAYANVI
jgi:hypothetical protein